MNCSVCGAENDADARFCAECGAPLESPAADQLIIPGQLSEESLDDDVTIISSQPEPDVRPDVRAMSSAEDQAEPDIPAPETGSGLPPVPEPPPPPVREHPASAVTGPMPPMPSESQPPPSCVAGPDDRKTDNRKMWLIVGLVILALLLCCCCFSLAIGALVGADPTLLNGLL